MDNKVNDYGKGKEMAYGTLEHDMMSVDEARVVYSEAYSGDEETEMRNF